LVSVGPVNDTTAGTSSLSTAVVAQFFGVISAGVGGILLAVGLYS